MPTVWLQETLLTNLLGNAVGIEITLSYVQSAVILEGMFRFILHILLLYIIIFCD